MRFQIKKSAEDTYEFTGPINETFDVSMITPASGPLKLRLAGVTNVNSVGVALFVKFVDSWQGRPVEYHECPEILIDAMQMLPALLGPESNTARIQSFRWPVQCLQSCGRVEMVLKASDLGFTQDAVTVGATCLSCQGAVDLIGNPDVLLSLHDSGALGQPAEKSVAAAAPEPAAQRGAGRSTVNASQQVLTVMFIDVAGFSLLAEDRLPNDLFRELKPFISRMRKIVREHGGIVDKVLGDGIMAYFGYDPAGRPVMDQGLRALECAIALQRQSLDFCLSAKSQGSALYPIRIGLNTSQVYVGDLGDDDRAEFTVIGHGVNYAKRIEDSCDIFMIMLSDATKAAVDQAQQAGRPGFLRRHINIKHHDRLFAVYEFNPFVDKPEALNRARKAFQEFQGVFRQEARRRLKADAPLEVTTDYGPCRIVDFSPGGLQVKLDKYLARGVNLRLSVQATGSDRKAQYLNLIGLSSLNCVVRWGAPGDGGYLHGLKILNLNDEQKKILLTMLSSYLENDSPAA
jgi:class 3 adenylate cyclase